MGANIEKLIFSRQPSSNNRKNIFYGSLYRMVGINLLNYWNGYITYRKEQRIKIPVLQEKGHRYEGIQAVRKSDAMV